MKLVNNFPIKQLNTFGINVLAKYFAEFNSIAGLEELLSISEGNKMILGGGSNILFTKDFDGTLLKNNITGIEKIAETPDAVLLKVGAGVVWHDFVLYCLENNYAGVENLALIPGSVGASPIQNIGAYGVEVKSVIHSVQAFHLMEKSVTEFLNADCRFGYRNSIFKNESKGKYAIVSVVFKLNKKPVFNISYGAIGQELDKMGITDLSIQSIAKAVINIRQSKLPDPAVIGNAGSFFKNPEVSLSKFEELRNEFPEIVGYNLDNGNVKLAAGWLIEQCNWKGFRRGDAGCHAKQALVLVNYGNASGSEIYELSSEIILSVKQKFGIELEREVNIV